MQLNSTITGRNLQGAIALASWTRAHYPTVYAALARQVGGRGNSGTRNIAGLGCACNKLGDDTTLDYFTPTLTSADYVIPDGYFDFLRQGSTSVPSLSATYDALPPLSASGSLFDTLDLSSMQSTSVNFNLPPAPTVSAPAGAVSSSGGVLSSVGKFLTTGGGLTALVGLGGQVIAANAASDQAKAQQAILQLQAQRVAAGQNPAAISYTTDPATGAVVPVLTTPQGNIRVGTNVLSALRPGGFLSQYGLYIIGGVVLLLVLRR